MYLGSGLLSRAHRNGSGCFESYPKVVKTATGNANSSLMKVYCVCVRVGGWGLALQGQTMN